jgi:hypothetical protein
LEPSVSRPGLKGRRRKGISRASVVSAVDTTNGIGTSGLHFLGADADELLHLLGLDLPEGPGLLPFRLRGQRGSGGEGILLGLGVGVAAEDPEERRHGGAGTRARVLAGRKAVVELTEGGSETRV